MSSDATEVKKPTSTGASEGVTSPKPADKGKGKGKSTEPPADDAMDDDDEDDDDDDEEKEEDDDDDMDDEEELEEIDPTAIRSRRTRGVRVDYTSKEALEKAGLKPEDMDKDDD